MSLGSPSSVRQLWMLNALCEEPSGAGGPSAGPSAGPGAAEGAHTPGRAAASPPARPTPTTTAMRYGRPMRRSVPRRARRTPEDEARMTASPMPRRIKDIRDTYDFDRWRARTGPPDAGPSALRGGQGQGGASCGVPDELDPSGPIPFGHAFLARTR